MTYIRRLIRYKMTYENQIRLNKKKKEDNKRRIKILEIVKQHGKIHSNLLKNELHKSLGTGTKTFDYLKKEMVENQSLVKTRIKNRSYYSLKFDFENHKEMLIKNIKVDVTIAKKDMFFLIDFQKYDLLNKSVHIIFILKNLFRILEKISVFNAMYGDDEIVEKKELKIRQYLKEIFKIIRNNKDGQIIMTLIQNNQFPKRYSYTINELPTSS